MPPVSRLAYGCAHLAGWSRAPPDFETRAAASALLHGAFARCRGVAGGRRLYAIARAAEVSRFAVALAWLLRYPAGVVPVVGTTDLAHLADNMRALDLVLSHTDCYALAALAADLPDPRIAHGVLPDRRPTS